MIEKEAKESLKQLFKGSMPLYKRTNIMYLGVVLAVIMGIMGYQIYNLSMIVEQIRMEAITKNK